MGIKLYQNNFYGINNILILTFVLLFLYACKERHVPYEDEKVCADLLFHSPYIALQVDYKDSIYNSILQESDLYMFPPLGDIEIRKDLFTAISKPIKVDSIQWNHLTNENYIIIPQECIDSVYKNDVRNLIPLVDWRKSNFSIYTISKQEQHYLIYLLAMNKVYLFTDCESGFFKIINEEDLRLLGIVNN